MKNEEIKKKLDKLKKEFWKNESRINGRKATRQEKAELRRRNREIFQRVGELTNSQFSIPKLLKGDD